MNGLEKALGLPDDKAASQEELLAAVDRPKAQPSNTAELDALKAERDTALEKAAKFDEALARVESRLLEVLTRVETALAAQTQAPGNAPETPPQPPGDYKRTHASSSTPPNGPSYLKDNAAKDEKRTALIPAVNIA